MDIIRWPPRSAPPLHGGIIFWTSPPSACTSGTTIRCWTPAEAGIWATPRWWWSTTRTPCGPRISSWTWAPGAGIHGGEIVATGTAEEIIMACPKLTGAIPSGAVKIPVPERPAQRQRPLPDGPGENNLKDRRLHPPGHPHLRHGVSGNGKPGQRDHLQEAGGGPEPGEGPRQAQGH